MLFIEQPQSMPEGNPRRSVNFHVHTCLHTRFFLLYGIARGIHDWRIRNTKLLVAEPFQMSHSGGKRIKQSYESKNVTVTRTKFLHGTCDCTVTSDVGMGDFSLVLELLHVCGHAHVRSHVS